MSEDKKDAVDSALSEIWKIIQEAFNIFVEMGKVLLGIFKEVLSELLKTFKTIK